MSDECDTTAKATLIVPLSDYVPRRELTALRAELEQAREREAAVTRERDGYEALLRKLIDILWAFKDVTMPVAGWDLVLELRNKFAARDAALNTKET